MRTVPLRRKQVVRCGAGKGAVIFFQQGQGCDRRSNNADNRNFEKHQLDEGLFAEVGRVLQASGMKLASGTIVDRR